MKQPLLLILTFLTAWTIESCSYDKKEIAPAQTTGSTTAVDTAISYSKTIKPIIITYCYGSGDQTCHVSNSSEGAPGDFTQFSELKARIDAGSFDQRVFVRKDMPPSNTNGPQTLSTADANKLAAWIKQGAKNN